MEELELQFLGFLGACQGVFGPFGLILILDPLGAGHAFLRQRHMHRRGGYLFLPWFFSLYDAIHGWMMARMMDGSRDEKNFTKNDHNVFYYM
jgi:hypothetical protein